MKPPPQEQAIADMAREILQRPEYARHRNSRSEWGGSVLEAAADFLQSLAELRVSSPGLYWCLLGGLLLLLALLVAHVTWVLRAALKPRPTERREPQEIETDFAERAQQLANRGQHLEAAHELLLASLRHAAHRRVLMLHPEHGNRRVCQELRQSALPRALRENLVSLIEETDATWFGHRGGGERLYQRWREALRQLRRAA